MKKFTEEDFLVLRSPFQSGRQSPGSLTLVLILGLIFQPLLFFLTHIVAADATNFPKVDIIFTIHLWITGILMVLSLIYSISPIYMRGQKIQYLLSILVSQNIFGVCMYISAIFLIGGLKGITEQGILIITFLTLFWGLIVFVMTSIRFYMLLLDGQYRAGSIKHEQRSSLESQVKSYVPKVIGISTALVILTISILRVFGVGELNELIVIILGMLLYFTMIFVLPEQLVILYCKFRYDSFNYSKKGKLKSFQPQKKRGKRKKK